MSWLDEIFDEVFGEEEGEEEEEEEFWEFETAMDERVCDVCGPLDGEVFSVDELEEYFPDGWEIGLGVIQANVHPNCRCTLQLVEGSMGDY